MNLFYGVRNEQLWPLEYTRVLSVCVCVIFLSTLLSKHLQSDEWPRPCFHTTLKSPASSHLSRTFLVNQFTAECHKSTKIHANEWSRSPAVWAVTWQRFCSWHHRLRGERETREAVAMMSAQQALRCCQGVWAESRCPRRRSGVLISQLESDTTAGWGQIRPCCTGLGSRFCTGQLWCFSWRLCRTKACVYLLTAREGEKVGGQSQRGERREVLHGCVQGQAWQKVWIVLFLLLFKLSKVC